MPSVLLLHRLKTRTHTTYPQKYASLLVALSTGAFLVGTMLPVEDVQQLSEKERQSGLFMAVFLLFFTVVILSESLFFYFLLLVRSSLFKQFLGSSLLAPIGRLSLSIYLLNPLVNWTRLHQVRQTAPLTMQHLVSFQTCNCTNGQLRIEQQHKSKFIFFYSSISPIPSMLATP